MSDNILSALLATIAPTILALASLVQAMKNGEVGRDNAKKLDTGIEKLDRVHELANGMSLKLQEDAKVTGRAEGMAEGIEKERGDQIIRDDRQRRMKVEGE